MNRNGSHCDKDGNLHLIAPPEGIMLTLPVIFFDDRKTTVEEFRKYFEKVMSDEDTLWHFKLTNLPKQDVAWVYLVFGGLVQFRLNLVQYERNVSKRFSDTLDGRIRTFPTCNWVILAGPPIKPPYEIHQKGFQGFRYTRKIF